MKAFQERIRVLFAEQEGMVVEALAALGYVPKQEGIVSIPAANAAAIAAALGVSVEQLAGDVSKLPAGKQAAAASPAAIVEAEEKLRGQILAVIEACALGGMEKMVAELVRSKASLDEAKTKILAAKADESGRTHIRSTVGATTVDGKSPLVADAEARAQAASGARKAG